MKSLLKESAYPEPTANVRLIETHVSFIFITDSFVYKIKKPVDFGFLNFTTVDRRRFYCEEEVRLNRRLCPDIYLGVVELRETPEGGKFGNGGRILDYAVKMKRLPEERMLSRLLEKGAVGPEQMRELAAFIARFHGKAATGPEIDRYGSVEAIRANWEENFSQMAGFRDRTLATADLDLMRRWVSRFLEEKAQLFRGRVAGGFIRDCDGDLHMDNICLDDGICIFDCIEFNDKFRYIDTASDIAFLLMDLEYAGRPDLCAPFLETYRRITGDDCSASLLNFYKCHRAFVRGKVKSLRLTEPGIPAGQSAEAQESARRYFRLARGYALRDKLPPSLVITCGLMGTGKSTMAAELAFELGLLLERSDQVRKSLAGVPSTGRGEPEPYDAGIYRDSHSEATYRELLQRARKSLLAGGSIIVDATFRRKKDRDAFRTLAVELRVPFFVIETRCTEKLVRERLERRRHDPNEISDGRWEIFPRQRSEFEATAPGEAIVVDTSLPIQKAVDRALKGMELMT